MQSYGKPHTLHSIRNSFRPFSRLQHKIFRIFAPIKSKPRTKLTGMKKRFSILVLCVWSAMLLSAQIRYEVPPLSQPLDSMCREVAALRADSPEKAYLKFAKIAMLVQNRRDDLIAVGDFFRRNGVHPCDSLCAERVYAIAANDLDALKFRAVVLEDAKSYALAAQMYDMILERDSDNVSVLYQSGRINKKDNPAAATQYFLRAVALDSAYWQAWGHLGDLYAADNDNERAIECYDHYYAHNPKEDLDLSSCANYLSALFIGQRSDSVARIAGELLPLAPRYLHLRRMRFLGLMGTYDSNTASEPQKADIREAMRYVVDGEYPDSDYINLDYRFVSGFYEGEGQIPEAVAYMERAIARDTTLADNYKTLADLYRRNNRYDESLASFAAYMEKKGEGVSTNDRLILMQTYLDAALQDSLDAETKERYIADGLTICNDAIGKAPKAWQLYRARANFFVARRGDNNLDEAAAADYVRTVELLQALDAADREKNYDNVMFNLALRLSLYYIKRGQEFDNAGLSEQAALEYADCWKYNQIAYAISPTHSVTSQIHDILKADFAPKPTRKGRTTRRR